MQRCCVAGSCVRRRWPWRCGIAAFIAPHARPCARAFLPAPSPHPSHSRASARVSPASTPSLPAHLIGLIGLCGLCARSPPRAHGACPQPAVMSGPIAGPSLKRHSALPSRSTLPTGCRLWGGGEGEGRGGGGTHEPATQRRCIRPRPRPARAAGAPEPCHACTDQPAAARARALTPRPARPTTARPAAERAAAAALRRRRGAALRAG